MRNSDHARGASRPRFVVLGAYLIDCLVSTERLPAWGDDLEADSISTSLGGKALSQATVLARHGAQVTAIGAVGDDAAGRDLRRTLTADGIDTGAMLVHPSAPTPTCVVFSDLDAHNAIVWRVPEALVLTPAVVERAAQAIRDADALLVTMEIPPETIRLAIGIARTAGTRVVVNPAPFPADPAVRAAIPWDEVDILVPNEAEARVLLPGGHPAANGPADDLPRAVSEALGVPYVCVTLADRGCATWDGSLARAYPARAVTPVDVTSASDAFVPTLALHLLAGCDPGLAVDRALAAAAITVSRFGTYRSLPRRAELTSPFSGPGQVGQPAGGKLGDSGFATEPTAEMTGRSASSA